MEDFVADVDMLIVRVATREMVRITDADAENTVDTLPVAERELPGVRERLALPEEDRLKSGLALDLKLADTQLLSDGERDEETDTVTLAQMVTLRDAEGVTVVDFGGEIDLDGEPEFVELDARENELVDNGVAETDTAPTVSVGEFDVRNEKDATGDFVSDRELVPVLDTAGEPDGEPDTEGLELSPADEDGDDDSEFVAVSDVEMDPNADKDADAERLS